MLPDVLRRPKARPRGTYGSDRDSVPNIAADAARDGVQDEDRVAKLNWTGSSLRRYRVRP